jgi:hypothetical protein
MDSRPRRRGTCVSVCKKEVGYEFDGPSVVSERRYGTCATHEIAAWMALIRAIAENVLWNVIGERKDDVGSSLRSEAH